MKVPFNLDYNQSKPVGFFLQNIAIDSILSHVLGATN